MGRSREEVTIVEPGKDRYPVRPGVRNVFRRVPNTMTVSFLIDSAGDRDHPRYVLETADGAYRAERTPKDDLVPGDDYLQLRFDDLLPGGRYTLTRWLDPDHSEVVFSDVPWSRIVDQPHPTGALLEDARFARLEGGPVKEAELPSPEPPDGDAA